MLSQVHLYHKLVIRKLPDRVLLNLLHDCSLIADEIYYLGGNEYEPHRITKKVLRYPINHFTSYCYIVIGELIERGLPYDLDIETISILGHGLPVVEFADIFVPWMGSSLLKYDYNHLMYFDNAITELERLQLARDIEEIWYTIC